MTIAKSDHQFRSDEEAYVYWYFSELKTKGFVSDIEYEVESIKLGKDHFIEKNRYLKTKVERGFHKLVGEREYTYDFRITWTNKAREIFFRNVNDLFNPDVYFLTNLEDGKEVSLIEVKATHDPTNSAREARTKIAWVWFQHQRYVQLVIPVPQVKGPRKVVSPASALFNATFVPLRYFTTDGGGRRRKINFEAKTLDEYIQLRNNNQSNYM